jgi:3-deoxy-manno-octulosonate cytidylyltransferase (CMP-KDO synthetase)
MEIKKNSIGIIPARMGSSRFPGKPLEEILGLPMIAHVYYRAKMSPSLSEVYIATCDEEIRAYGESIGAKVIMTKNTHERASDRAAEAVEKIESSTGETIDIVVMIQGDEPMLIPEMIDLAIQPFYKDSTTKVVNLMAPIKTEEEFVDPNCPKVVVDKNSNALYFSREPIPSTKKWKGGPVPMYKQVCVIPFTRAFLTEYSSWTPTPHEEVESIDMNRVLEYGHKVRMVYEEFETYCVDTPDDLKRVETHMRGDGLIEKYG